MTISPFFRLCLYLIILIPSLFCSLFTLYYYLLDRNLRKILSNHVLVLITTFSLIYNLTDIVWLIDFCRNGYTLLPSRSFCLIWTYIDFSVFVSISYLVVWASIERHLLIFHQSLISTKFNKILFHYIPMFTFGFYPLIYYLIIIFFVSCPLVVNTKKTRCGLTNCGYGNGLTTLWDGIFNNIIPVFTIIVFSLLLIVRVRYQKFRMGQRFQWKKYRKMTIQLLSISLIYLIFLFPSTILLCLYSSGLSYSIGADFYSASLYLSYVITLLLPFVLTFSLPELRKKFFKLVRLSQRFKRSILPQIIAIQPLPLNRTTGNRTIPK